MGNGRRTILGFALVVLLLDFGCTGSDQLVSGTGNLSLAIEMDPPGAGRYDSALITVMQVTVRPTDPVANSNLGAVPFGLLASPFTLTLQNTSTAVADGIPLSDGQYRLEEVVMENPILTDFDPIESPATCLEGVLVRSGGRLPSPEINTAVTTIATNKIKLGPFSPPIVFNVPRLEDHAIRMIIDGPGLAAIFEAAFTCRTAGTCSGPPSASAPCMNAFTPITAAQAATVIHFE